MESDCFFSDSPRTYHSKDAGHFPPPVSRKRQTACMDFPIAPHNFFPVWGNYTQLTCLSILENRII
jgi:hypothetical protein